MQFGGWEASDHQANPLDEASVSELTFALGDLPTSVRLSGRGLWLTRLLADRVEFRNGDGFAVAIHATAPRLT